MKLKSNYPDEDEKTGSNPESKRVNRRILFNLSVLIIGLYPIVYISEDNILKIIVYSYIAYYIKTNTNNHGKRYGQMALRFGKGVFLNLKVFYVFFAISFGSVFIEDFASEVLIYKAKHSYHPKNIDTLIMVSSFYKGASFLPDLINSVIALPLDEIKTKEGGFLDLLKKKLKDHIYYESTKREHSFKIIDLRERGLFVKEEKSGVFDYFIKKNVVRVFDSIVDSLKFMIQNFIWTILYYLVASKVALIYIKRNSSDFK